MRTLLSVVVLVGLGIILGASAVHHDHVVRRPAGPLHRFKWASKVDMDRMKVQPPPAHDEVIFTDDPTVVIIRHHR